jgi:hypothetical protein
MKCVTKEDRAVTRLQWDLFKETQCYAKPYWVIQGDKGGHQRFMTTFESQQMQLMGLPMNPPIPGTLPYAPFDQRVKTKILKHDKLRQIGERLALLKETQKARYKSLQADLEKKFRQDIVDFVSDQITIDEGRDVKRAIRDTAPIEETDYEKLWEEGTERFVESGTFAG